MHVSCRTTSVRGSALFLLTVFYLSGQVCNLCYPSYPDNKDSLQTRTATKEKPVNSAFAYGICHKMHDVLQGSLLAEEGYVRKVKDLGVQCSANFEALLSVREQIQGGIKCGKKTTLNTQKNKK